MNNLYLLLKLFLYVGIFIIGSNAYAENETITLPNTQEQRTIKSWPLTLLELEKSLSVVNTFLYQWDDNLESPGWDLMSELITDKYTKDDWNTVFDQVTIQYGKRLDAEFNRAFKTDSLPSGINGDIAIIILLTNFEKLKANEKLAESITLIKESGSWRLASYNYQLITINRQ